MSVPDRKETYFCQVLAEILNLPEVDGNQDLLDLDIGSLAAMQFFEILNEEMNTDIPTIVLFEYPTINSLLSYAAGCARE